MRLKEKDWELWVLLHQAADATYHTRNLELSKSGTSMMQIAVIEVIKQIGQPVTTVQISRCLVREHHSTAAMLKRMIKLGLVSYDTKKSNQSRKKKFVLTEKGIEIYRKSQHSEVIKNILSTLKNGEKDTLKKQLKSLRDKAMYDLPYLKLNKHSYYHNFSK